MDLNIKDQKIPTNDLIALQQLERISTKWVSHILWHLEPFEHARFGELQSALTGISGKMLSQRLKMLEEIGWVWREQKPTIPVTVYYGLTPPGKVAAKALYCLICKIVENERY
ncbi:helix-turn-helix transcriptional regulator [Vibrio cholerae]|nr:helix-turn-helix transcriptional regulator [Vibrio cholerae]ELJ8693215.1 helix-turn-helix transcriptional regulator [Vibrio cholerae]